MNTIKLNNGVRMPQLGFGVFQISNEETERVVSDALKVGYRLIDTAQAYGNEAGVGAAIKSSGIDRKEIFLVDKIWLSNYGYEKAKASIDESLRKLATDYIDLMLLHQPFGDTIGAYRAMEDAAKDGKLRAIGVSNFYTDHYADFIERVDTVPAVDQIENHVFTQQHEARKMMLRHGTAPMSWGPLAEGKNGIFGNKTLTDIAEKHGKTSAQVALRYLYDMGVIIIPKSARVERMKQNFDILDFHLTAVEMEAISKLDTKKPFIMDHHNPQTIEWFKQFIKESPIIAPIQNRLNHVNFAL